VETVILAVTPGRHRMGHASSFPPFINRPSPVPLIFLPVVTAQMGDGQAACRPAKSACWPACGARTIWQAPPKGHIARLCALHLALGYWHGRAGSTGSAPCRKMLWALYHVCLTCNLPGHLGACGVVCKSCWRAGLWNGSGYTRQIAGVRQPGERLDQAASLDSGSMSRLDGWSPSSNKLTPRDMG
jgi:hypothetical protein